MSKLEEYLKTVKTVYKDVSYDYSKVENVHSHSLIEIGCPIHGWFTRTAFDFKKGKGCPICAVDKAKKERQRTKFKKFLEVAAKVHDGKYSYSKVIYTKMKEKVVIGCPIHGSFLQTPHNHMNGCGCSECGKEKCGDVRRNTTKDFIDKSKQLHPQYIYDKVEYVNQFTPVTLTCPLHGDFTVVPKAFLKGGSKCPSCRVTNCFNENLPAILYYLRIDYKNHTAYKIGITNRTVSQRYTAKDLAKITVLAEIKYELGSLARQEETNIKREFKKYRWIGVNLLTDGNSELFDRDVLGLDAGVSYE